MAYNLESLVQILEQILEPDHDQPLWVLDSDKKPQMKTLLQKVYFFIDLLENSSSAVSGYRRRGLESRIRDTAYNAEDVLESHLVDQLLSCREGESFIFSPPDLEKLIEDFESANKEMMSSMEANEMQLKYRLMGGGSKLEVIPIVGMGGIGKTTLARNLYKDRLVSFHFGVRAWATISQDHDVGKILLGLLRLATRGPTYETLEMGHGELGELLYKTLFGRRYLIVLDDIWQTEPWDDIRRFLPDNNNGSRIIITTRALYVADHIDSGSSLHRMSFLNSDESWNLIHQKVFGAGETCSRGLESVGRKIADNCGGLPLTITVIGGLLSQAERKQVFWEQVAEDVSSAIADEDEHFFGILSVSYNYLPYHLKPCLLYICAFPEDYEIHASRLIKLWVAEGFLKPISGKSLEEAAEMYLMNLVDRNLIFIAQQRPEGKVKSYGIHDVLRDLCLKKAHEENFLFINRWYMRGGEDSRRVCAHSIQDILDISFNPMLSTRSFLFTGVGSQEKLHSSVISAFNLLRVLDILEIKFPLFPKEMLELVNLRYLALSTSELPSSISSLWNLRILIFQSIALSPMRRAMMPKILGMAELRHIKFKGFYVWYDNEYVEHFVVQDKLQSLSTIAIPQLTYRFLQTIPNLEKLGIFCDEEVDHVKDLSCLHKLRTLKCASLKYDGGNLLSNLVFPHSLKKLTLRDCGVLDLDMNRIADGTHFPRLEHLVIRHCLDLEAIPLGIGDIPTLKVIEVHECSSSAVNAARMIQEEQQSYGNDELEVRFGTLYQLQSVESRIRDVAYNAEDVLESHLEKQLLSSHEGQSFTSFPPDLEEVIEDFDYAKEEMMAIVEGREMHPKHRLMRRQPNLDVFVTVGMGGIGKTTLARNLYDDPFFHFDIRAWVTISQDYSLREILLSLLHCVIGKLTHELLEKKNGELGSYLSEHLGRRRYLIVLDDIWDIKPWDDL
ncbi:UNVERIFIED_CONTAM: putative late blight resistance proteinR1B-14 [Sesamum angustifolium]|uniref:Late blight resistance proteinR1B-14 n=1 Tax=Sesamum angustifolium TaxID=2727405 RepID=A0AAW2QBN5_9LAMI